MVVCYRPQFLQACIGENSQVVVQALPWYQGARRYPFGEAGAQPFRKPVSWYGVGDFNQADIMFPT